MKRVLFITLGFFFFLGISTLTAKEKVKIGVIQITFEHEYQQVLKKGYMDTAAKMGAEAIIEVSDMSPEKTVKVAENLIAAGVKAIICAPADTASWSAVLDMCVKAKIPLLNDGGAQELKPGMVPYIGTDSYKAGLKAGNYAGKWINDNLGGSATVAHLTLPTFTDCVKRNEGFVDGLQKTAKGKITLLEEVGKGAREPALTAMENLLQGNPDIAVVFGCNDDSALGAMGAMLAAGKDPKKSLIMGVDGTIGSFKAIKDGGMFRLDVVQLPYTYASMHMERAVKLARGEAKIADYVKQGPIFMETPAVDKSNVDEWIKKVSAYLKK